jgi:hypothetical protein
LLAAPRDRTDYRKKQMSALHELAPIRHGC